MTVILYFYLLTIKPDTHKHIKSDFKIKYTKAITTLRTFWKPPPNISNCTYESFMESCDWGIRSVSYYTAAPKHCSTVSPWTSQQNSVRDRCGLTQQTGLVLRVKRSRRHIYCVIVSTERETQQISQTVVTAGRPRHHHTVTSQNSGAFQAFQNKGLAKRAARLRQPRPDLRIPKISPEDINPFLQQSGWSLASLINVSAALN